MRFHFAANTASEMQSKAIYKGTLQGRFTVSNSPSELQSMCVFNKELHKIGLLYYKDLQLKYIFLDCAVIHNEELLRSRQYHLR